MYIRKPQQKERWIFIFRQQGDLNIEYLEPHKRRIVLAGMTLWEYIPETAKAICTVLDALDAEKRREIISSVLSHATAERIRIVDYAVMPDRVVSVRPDEEEGSVYSRWSLRESSGECDERSSLE